jgi:hypothetical protein
MIPFITVEVGDPILSDDDDLNLDTGSKEVKYHANRTWKNVWSKSADQMIVESTMQVVSWNQMLHHPAWINKYGIVLLPNSMVSKTSAIQSAKRGNRFEAVILGRKDGDGCNTVVRKPSELPKDAWGGKWIDSIRLYPTFPIFTNIRSKR